MYLISKLRLYMIFAGFVVLIVLLTINSYFVFIKLNPEHALSAKYFAENIIFYTLIGLIILAILLANTISRHKDLLRELDKIVELSLQGTNSLQVQFKKLGLLGEKISEINGNLNSLNELKSQKISAQSGLVNSLLEKTDARLIITNAEGRILKVSNGLLDYLQVTEKRFANVFIDDLLTDIDPSQLINNLRRTKSVGVKSRLVAERERPVIDSVWAFFPIFNARSELVYCLGLLSEQKVIPMPVNPAMPVAQPQEPSATVIDRITDFVRSKFERPKNEDRT